jgi:hypothetical protein
MSRIRDVRLALLGDQSQENRPMDRLSLSAMSFAGLGLLLIAGTGVAGAGRTQDADKTCARIGDQVPGVEPSGSRHVEPRNV